MEMPQELSRITVLNIGLFVLIWLHFPHWFQYGHKIREFFFFLVKFTDKMKVSALELSVLESLNQPASYSPGHTGR